MNSGEIQARHFLTGRTMRLRWQDGLITEVQEMEMSAPSGPRLAPALVDLQVNGYAGIDFQQDHLSVEELLAATRRLARDGCTRYLLTLVSDDWPRLVARLRHLRRQRAASAELQHAIAGWHIEGPFLSAEPGYCGAHDPAVMIDPEERHLRELRDVTGTDPVLLTLAPERPGSLDAIRRAVELGMVVSLGHTNASAERLAAAVGAGARAFTHLGNGCPRTLDRSDNILLRVLDTPGLQISLIPDAIHVARPFFRLVHRVVSPERLFYVTDAMAAAAAPPGRYKLGKMELEVGADQVVHLPGQPNFAGSALSPMEGVRRAARLLDGSWAEAWAKSSLHPSHLMQWPLLQAGCPADFCLIEADPGGALRHCRTFNRGVELPE